MDSKLAATLKDYRIRINENPIRLEIAANSDLARFAGAQ